ncbi:holin [Streptomyces sp. NBC_01477]|uniref:holin n=1 Tax=Streptomyces sp. NBC_01477 TaxID=2976015 RepID=UPI002E318747|nr:holin [Streptomyces sp. NBC_01477]
MPRAGRWRVCSVPGCPEYTQDSRCTDHTRAADRARGTARQRGYGRAHEQRFRPGVLRRDPMCTCPGCPSCCRGGAGRCVTASAHADHWPLDRRQLVLQGLDPDDPQHGRGLCGPCHSSWTATEQPGGWNA